MCNVLKTVFSKLCGCLITMDVDPNLIQFINCEILRDHKIIKEDLWVRNGKILNPEKVFFDEKVKAGKTYDCLGLLIAPGFIDIQINGGFGYDFSYNTENVEKGINVVAKKLLAHGVTAFCPTVVTSPKEIYHKILPKIRKRAGDINGATILGVHATGPFINVEKKGGHPENCIRGFEDGFQSLLDTYGDISNIKIVTLAPELPNAGEVIAKLSKRGIVVAVGHSMAHLNQGEEAVVLGVRLITHIFNAMLPFHHRDPGLVGLLASNKVPQNETVYFGIIADGFHTHPAALRIAYRTHPDGLILVTDAISALGLEDGKHNLGQLTIEVRQGVAYIANTSTLCGSITSMNSSIKLFLQATECSVEYVLEAASLHPAKSLGIDNFKGTLNFGSDADFVMLDNKLNVQSTWIAGKCVFTRNDK